MSSADPFDDLLELENGFYKEGYEAGVADSEYVGMIEGKVFGIEKGYEKVLELANLHGRATVWSQRLASSTIEMPKQSASVSGDSVSHLQRNLPGLPESVRLRKHVDNLLSLTDPNTLPKDNSDASVTGIDERVTKSKARAKMISTMIGESVNPSQPSTSGIEDSTGLSARH